MDVDRHTAKHQPDHHNRQAEPEAEAQCFSWCVPFIIISIVFGAVLMRMRSHHEQTSTEDNDSYERK